ncbi:MAG: hypothetical protein ACRD4O_02510, partial [Bryobacteraceae bacterium]
MGIQTLAKGLRALGERVELITPQIHLPVFTLERILFNECLRYKRFHTDILVGVDLDGYRVMRHTRMSHVAAI